MIYTPFFRELYYFAPYFPSICYVNPCLGNFAVNYDPLFIFPRQTIKRPPFPRKWEHTCGPYLYRVCVWGGGAAGLAVTGGYPVCCPPTRQEISHTSWSDGTRWNPSQVRTAAVQNFKFVPSSGSSVSPSQFPVISCSQNACRWFLIMSSHKIVYKWKEEDYLRKLCRWTGMKYRIKIFLTPPPLPCSLLLIIEIIS